MSDQLNGTFEGKLFTDIEFGDVAIRKSAFVECRFERCTFDRTKFIDCTFSDCSFHSTDLLGVSFAGTGLVRVSFEQGQAMGVDWTEARHLLLSLEFRSVRMDYSNFSGLALQSTAFGDCSLKESIFDGCDLSDAVFGGCDLSGAIVRMSDLTRTDFRNASGCSVDVGTCKLGGTLVDADAAMLMLHTLGVQCQDLETILGLR